MCMFKSHQSITHPFSKREGERESCSLGNTLGCGNDSEHSIAQVQKRVSRGGRAAVQNPIALPTFFCCCCNQPYLGSKKEKSKEQSIKVACQQAEIEERCRRQTEQDRRHGVHQEQCRVKSNNAAHHSGRPMNLSEFLSLQHHQLNSVQQCAPHAHLAHHLIPGSLSNQELLIDIRNPVECCS